MTGPKKYIKVNGVTKLNPEYKKWQERQTGVGTATSLKNSDQALPVVASMDDYMRLNDELGTEIPLAESTTATIEMMQEPEISLEAGMQPDEMVDLLGAVLAKYEVPMGLMNKVRKRKNGIQRQGSHVRVIPLLKLTRYISFLVFSS
jgi:hypothetical protein